MSSGFSMKMSNIDVAVDGGAVGFEVPDENGRKSWLLNCTEDLTTVKDDLEKAAQKRKEHGFAPK